MHDIFATATVVAVPVLGILIGHWFPWRRMLKRDLPLLARYAWGVSWFMVVPTFATISHGYGWIAAAYMGSAIVAGAATAGAYLLDQAIETRDKLADERDRQEHASVRNNHRERV